MKLQTSRLFSLDAFRGLCMLGMLLVDYPGDWDNKYKPFIHAYWNGFTLADLIFPSFLFIVGVAMMFSLSKRKTNGDSHTKIMKHVAKRALILILLGWLSNAFLDSQPIYSLKTLRLMGVLQRIAIVYVICSYLYLKVRIKTLAYIGGGLLVGYWALSTLVPVPGYGTPNINIHPSEAIANLSVWLDSTILGNHIAEWNKPFDNEGILGTIPATATCILGMLVGAFLKTEKGSRIKTLWLFVLGTALLCIALVWNIWYPINKLLWSSSFVLYAGGWSILILASLYFVIDASGYNKWSKPFQALGKNAILVFTAALCFQGAFWRIQVPFEGGKTALRWMLYSKIFQPLLSDPLKTSILYTFAVILFWFAVSFLLHKKKIYLRT